MYLPLITNRNWLHRSIAVLVLTLIWSTVANADVSFTLTYSPYDLVWEERFGYDVVRLPGCSWTEEVGAPFMPTMHVLVLIGPHERVSSVDLVELDTEDFPGEYLILPGQPPVPISGAPPAQLAEPDPSIYQSSEPYPPRVVHFGGAGSLSGYRLVSLQVSPVRYYPSERRVALCRRIDVRVRTEPGDPALTVTRTSRSSALFKRAVGSTVLNIEDVERYAPPERIVLADPDNVLFDYVVVTTEELAPYFQPLVEWKNTKGVRAVIRTTDWVEEHYTGVDLQEQIRNYLNTAYRDSGLAWVLLGGDVTPLPHRLAVEDRTEGKRVYIPCDMYFSCLDGTWNANGNDVFGEVADTVDLYPDVYVARAPVESPTEVEDFVHKVIVYESGQASDYQNQVLFLADSLDNITEAGVAKDDIEDACLPPSGLIVTKLYAREGNLSRHSALNALNAGQGVINHIGHGNTTIMTAGEGGLSNSDFWSLTNGPRFSMFYTVGCYCGCYTTNDCIAEEFVKSSRGGGYFVGNSRYGWYSRGDPGCFSGEFDKEWWCQIFTHGNYYAGEAQALSKIPFIPSAEGGGIYRYITYELNLFGDPETPIWTSTLDTLQVLTPGSLLMGDAVACTVTVFRDGSPCPDATVCLYETDQIFETMKTDGSGEAIFTVSTATPCEVSLVASVHNARPYQSSLVVYPDCPYPLYAFHTIDDSHASHPNGRAEPGETDRLLVTLKNVGVGTATGIQATLSEADDPGYITVDRSTTTYPDILQGEKAVCDSSFIFSISPTCPQGHLASFVLEVTADGSFSNVDTFSVFIKSKHVLLVDDDGKGRGEEAYIITLDNLGYVYDLVSGSPDDLGELSNYQTVIWLTGKEYQSTLTEDDRAGLQAALDSGVSLFLSGQSIGDDIGETDFYHDYLHAACIDSSVRENMINGVSDHPMGSGLKLVVTDQHHADAIAPAEDAAPLFSYQNCGEHGAVLYQGDYRLVYFGFGFEGINGGVPGYSPPDTVLHRLLSWLGGAEEQIDPIPPALVYRLSQNAPNPFHGECQIGFQLPAAQHTTLFVYNTAGQRVRTLVDRECKAGSYRLTWDGKDDKGSMVAAGVYFYRLQAGENALVRKAVLLR